ncbi:hypothetical protein [Pseudomonas plecoglossicida]|uniref:hypothetical protein n=1 Tax=Pseudomonas plecoglossicida TaxID=70775 RepID=UPI003D1CE1E2
MLSTNCKVKLLKSRDNGKAFFEVIEALRVERARLQAPDTRMEGLKLVNIDQRAVATSKAVSPRKGMIILVALVGGMVSGGAWH